MPKNPNRGRGKDKNGECVTISCPSLQCVDRRQSLIDESFGFGADLSYLSGLTPVEITTLNDGSLEAAIQQGGTFIYFSDGLTGTHQHPLDAIDEWPADVYMDGRGSDVTIQFGNPDEVDGTTDVPSYTNQRYAWVNGNNGITCMDLKGDLRDFDQSDQDDALNFLNPETTDGVEIWGGANYYISRNTFTNFSDEAQSSVHITGTPTAITQAYNYFYMNRQVSIVGSMTAPENSIGTITQAYNWSDHTLFGRTPGIYRNMHAHVYNNVSEDYTSNGIQAWNNSEVISECNVLTPEPLGSLRRGNLFNTSGTPGVPGKLNDTGSFVSGGGGDFFYSEPLTNMFTIPYSYTKLAGTTQASIESYVKENAGSDACPTLNFCV